ncbi:MAG: SurA N-terminal domain-containing protein [Nitrospirota bacterium]
MLKAMRKHAKYFYILFFVVILTFIFWGVGTVDKTGDSAIVAEVGDYKITAEDYWRTYDNMYRFYREIYKDKFDEEMEKRLNLKDNVLESMISERLLLIAAKEAGISLSDEELRESIVREPAFMRNGKFDKDIYLSRLRLNRLTPELYENVKRRELLLDKMHRLIELSADSLESQLPQVTENAQMADLMGQAMLRDIREKATKSFINGLKAEIKIKIYKDLIS